MNRSTKNRTVRVVALLSVALFAIILALPFSACGGSAEDFKPRLVRINTDLGMGSGVITEVTEDGLICLTNAHVAVGASSLVAVTGDSIVEAELLGYSSYHDIAVLRIPAPPPEGMKALRVGRAVSGKTTALGADSDGSVGTGEGEIINPSARLRTATLEDPDSVKYVPAVATSAEIVQGMSGGALLNSSGELIGINAYSGSDGYYAVPIEIALSVQAAALAGEIEDKRVRLIGDPAYGGAYDEFGNIGLMVSQTSFAPLPYGFIGVFESGKSEGIRVTRAGSDCPVRPDDLVTRIGDLRVSAGDKNAVFAELYKYSESGRGKPLTLTTAGGGEKVVAEMRLKA